MDSGLWTGLDWTGLDQTVGAQCSQPYVTNPAKTTVRYQTSVPDKSTSSKQAYHFTLSVLYPQNSLSHLSFQAYSSWAVFTTQNLLRAHVHTTTSTAPRVRKEYHLQSILSTCVEAAEGTPILAIACLHTLGSLKEGLTDTPANLNKGLEPTVRYHYNYILHHSSLSTVHPGKFSCYST